MANKVVECPFCSGHMEIETGWLGLNIACPHCGKEFVLGEKAPERKRTMDVRESSMTEASVENNVKRSMGITTNRTGIAAIIVSSLALIFSVAAFVVAMKSVAMKSEDLNRGPVESHKAVPAAKKRIRDCTFRAKVPRGSKLKPTIAPLLFHAEKPSAGGVFFALVAITDKNPIGDKKRNYRGVDVWGFSDDNGVWRYSEYINGYARKDSGVGKRLFELVKDGKKHTCFVHLKPAYYTEYLGSDYELVDFEEIEAEELE